MTMPLTSEHDVTPTWLTDVFRRGGLLSAGRVTQVRLVQHLPASSRLFVFAVEYADAGHAHLPQRLLLKLPRERGLNRRQHEVDFYTRIAPAMPDAPCVRCYDAEYDAQSGHFHLLLEDLSATHRGHPPSMLPPPQRDAEGIVDSLAALHVFWWHHARLGSDIGQLPTQAMIAQEHESHRERYHAFATFLGDRLSRRRRQIYETLLNQWATLQLGRYRDKQRITLVHDDPHIGNFLYPYDYSQEQVRIIDWKCWHVGVGTSDLAHMMGVFWFPERRKALERGLLQRYHEQLLKAGISGYGWDACWYDYRWSIVNYLLYPLWQWSVGIPDVIWWHHLERLMLAYEDLACAELLEGRL